MPTPNKPTRSASTKPSTAPPSPPAPVPLETTPPAALNAAEGAAWAEIVSRYPPGVLTQSDAHLVELTSRLLVLSRQPGKLTAAVASQLRGALAELDDRLTRFEKKAEIELQRNSFGQW